MLSVSAASVMGGARSRLLPLSIPFRFFLGAVAFQVAAWAALLAGARQAVAFSGGGGPILAALHLATLGVLAMTAMGAVFQMLPVATRRPLVALWPARLCFWLFVPGVLLLTFGMATFSPLAMAAGGGLTVAGLALFAVLLASNLAAARGMTLVAAHGWVALASLLGLAGLGLALVGNFASGFLADPQGLAALHLVLAVYGFMGMLAMGFSYLLVPMFTLSPPVALRPGLGVLGPAVLALGAALLGRMTLAAGLGLVAAGVYLALMGKLWRTRLRKNLGVSFLLVRASWAMLPLSLGVGLFLSLGFWPDRLAPLFGFLAVGGWLLTFLVGILQRILPFLAAMHGGGQGSGQGNGAARRRPPLVSELAPEAPLKVQAALHGLALAGVSAGIVLERPALIALGAGLGLAGALALGVFAVTVMRRLERHRREVAP